MGKKTKIDWCDSTWNPVTGCLHGCKYCYARRIAERFDGGFLEMAGEISDDLKSMRMRRTTTHVLEEPKEKSDGQKSPYPFGFDPTFHRYRLDEPMRWTKPRNIFVCSMADLFGDWVPDEWIEEVITSCLRAPQHRYLFLTKNPERYFALHGCGMLPIKENFYYGITMDTRFNALKALRRLTSNELAFSIGRNPINSENFFASVEPMLEDFGADVSALLFAHVPWVIVGAETGSRKGIVEPKKAWIDRLVEESEQFAGAIFMKESLRSIMGYDFKQEFPWTK